MMRWQLSSASIPHGLVFAAEVSQAASSADIPPALPYAIKWNETGDAVDPAIVSADGGHGIMQLTSEVPSDWADPLANVVFAVRVYIVPAITFWNGVHGYTGDNLARCVFAEYNAGRGNTLAGHAIGDVDRYTTNGYAARALDNYHRLIAGQHP